MTLRLEWLDPKDLTPNPKNWRKHPKAQTEALAEILRQVGWAGALLYNEQTGRLIDGHLRQKVANDDKVPVLVGSWTEEQEALILATLDPLAAMAETDAKQAQMLLDGLGQQSEAIQVVLDGLVSKDSNLHLYTMQKQWCHIDQVALGCYACRSWRKGASDDYAKFLEWKQAPSSLPQVTQQMAMELYDLIEAWARGWRGFVVTVPPQGISQGREYAAGFLGKDVALLLGVDFVTVFGNDGWAVSKAGHYPLESIKQVDLPKVLTRPDCPIVIIDDAITSGTTARLCLKALEPAPCWFFAWVRNSSRQGQ